MILIISDDERRTLKPEFMSECDLIIQISGNPPGEPRVIKNRFGSIKPLMYLRDVYDLIESYIKLVF